ncbi:desert hedgehog protein [Xiphophorus hellerii]|uniref:desert hedgehog protein n=1 Tax=Xiphophorus hellerii TaxID=8084 RepID=UPI0013B43920|nr:desert hedgehog protein [Xiphophorus hellerii]
MKQFWWARLAPLGLLAACTCLGVVQGCGPGPGYGTRSRPRKLTPMRYKQFFPNFSENTLGASGRAEGKISRNSERFNQLVCNYNPDIVFKDEENTSADRVMTKRCKDCLNRLAIAVMNQWPGVHLRVTEAWDEDGHHPQGSLHYEGRAVDITTDDRETKKYGILAQLAVEAGFDWVHYESRYHIHCSVKADKSEAVERGGCFPGWARVTVAGGRQKTLSSLASGDRILALSGTGQVVYSQVLLFLHRDQESRSVFLSLEADGGNRLVVTPHHLVFLDPDCGHDANEYRAEFASRARVGDCVLIGTPGGQTETSRIVSVSLTESVGVFAPLTEAGTLFVDGVLVSSYALLEDHDLAHWAFGPLRLLHSLNHFFGGEDVKGKQKAGTKSATQFGTTEEVSIHKQNNLSEPLRVKDQEQCSLKTSEIHWYARLLYRFASIFLDSNIFHA